MKIGKSGYRGKLPSTYVRHGGRVDGGASGTTVDRQSVVVWTFRNRRTRDGWVRSQDQTVPLLHAFRHRYQIDRDTKDGLENEGQRHFLGAILGRLFPWRQLALLEETQLGAFDRNRLRHTEARNGISASAQRKDRWQWEILQIYSACCYLPRSIWTATLLRLSVGGGTELTH